MRLFSRPDVGALIHSALSQHQNMTVRKQPGQVGIADRDAEVIGHKLWVTTARPGAEKARGCNGKWIVKVEPAPGPLSTLIRPPCRSTISLTSGSPSPVPTTPEAVSRLRR